ncbi:hypothetical protein [Brevibacillus sp. SIMBA_040]|uniref:hypothetical protein n=1 Tax=unclassified Brevibacillus TaxID=2684853 RepID=UPI00397D610E
MQTEQSHQNKQVLIRILMLTLTISSMSALMFNIVLPEISTCEDGSKKRHSPSHLQTTPVPLSYRPFACLKCP